MRDSSRLSYGSIFEKKLKMSILRNFNEKLIVRSVPQRDVLTDMQTDRQKERG